MRAIMVGTGTIGAAVCDMLREHGHEVVTVGRRSGTFHADIADARSLAPRDLIPAERRYPDRVGEIYQVAYNPDHTWFYFPHMRRDEALVFKVYDSENDGRSRFTAHTSFDDPTTPPDAPPRQSIEVRTLAFFGPA